MLGIEPEAVVSACQPEHLDGDRMEHPPATKHANELA
jgi:hypothetical protein